MDRLTRMLSRILRNSRRRKHWQVFSTVLAGIVVFVTTYGLILPAITLEERAAEETPGVYLETENNIEEEEWSEEWFDDGEEGGFDVFEDDEDVSAWFDDETPDDGYEDGGDEQDADGDFYENDASPAVEDITDDGEAADILEEIVDDEEGSFIPLHELTGVVLDDAGRTDVEVRLTFQPEEEIPNETELYITEIRRAAEETAALYSRDLAASEEAVGEAYPGSSLSSVRFFDLSLVADGEQVEPASGVSVEMTFAEPLRAEQVAVLGFAEGLREQTEAQSASIPIVLDEIQYAYNADGDVVSVLFQTDRLAVFGVAEVTAEETETAEYDYEEESAEDAAGTEASSAEAIEPDAENAAEMAASSAESVAASVETTAASSVESVVEDIREAAETTVDFGAESIAETEGITVDSGVEDIAETEETTVDSGVENIAETEESSVNSSVEDVVEIEDATVDSGVEEVAGPDSTVEDVADIVDYPAQTFSAFTEEVRVQVFAEEGAFPAGTVMSVETVEDEETLSAISEAAGDAAHKIKKIHAVNITFHDASGQEIEPQKPIRVEMTAEEIAEEESALVVHVDNDGNAATLDNVEVISEESSVVATVTEDGTDAPTDVTSVAEAEVPDAETDTVAFDADAFSIYAIVYTVDFHYEVNGQTFEFSIPGGGFVSLEHVVEVLGIAGSGENDGSDVADGVIDKANGDAAKAVSLNEVEVSEAAKKFVADVASVEFSDPSLVDVSKVEETTTVGAIKETRGLEVEYSADLTEEQIAEINYSTVEAGDWALISVRAFASEETLTVRMVNGDVFTVKVTDAQISTHVITADGEDYIITVTYGPEAGIPDGATLEAEEILEGTEEYESMLEQSKQALSSDEETDVEIQFSRFFDVSILNADGEEIEPESPVSVSVQYAQAIDMHNARPSIVHFADDGIEVIEAKARLEGDGEEGTINVFEYQQSSFSGIGTITESAIIADGQYFLIHSADGKQYALSNDGSSVEVKYYSSTKQVEVLDDTDEQSLLWNIRSIGYGYYTYTASNGKYLTLDGDTIISDSSTNIYTNWVGYNYYTGAQGDGYELFNTHYSYDQDDWDTLCFSSDLEFSSGNGTSARMRMAKYSISGNTSGQVPSVNTYTGREVNPTELDEWLMSLFDDMPIGYDGYHKTAEVYDYENRIYQIDLTANSNAQGFMSDVDLAFSVDMSNSMLFPSVLKEAGTIEMKQSVLEDTLTKGQVYFVISDVASTATVNAVFYDFDKEKWYYEDASKYARGQRGGSNQDYLVPDTTTKIQGTDTGWYTLYTADQGYIDYINGSGSVYDNPYNRLADLKIGIKNAFNYLDIMAEKYHATVRVGWNGFARDVAYSSDGYDYSTKNNSDHRLKDLSKVDYKDIYSGIVNAGAQTGGGTRPDKAFQDAESYMGWSNNSSTQKYLILITDGAPQGGGAANAAAALSEAQKYGKQLTANKGVNIISIGLSTEHVKGADDLFKYISFTGPDNQQMIYQAKDGDALKNAMTDALRVLVTKATTVGTIKDTIDPAFYPVSTDGTPLRAGDKIDLNGKLTTDTSKPYGEIGWDGQNWTVEWKNQDIVWIDEDHPNGWHGRVLVKAKENFLGGNDISTNKGDATLDVHNAKVKNKDGSYSTVAFSQLMNLTADQLETRYMDTPHVNVDELEMTKNDTEWTVYLNTEVDPGEQMKALFNEIKVMKVVTDGEHEMVVANGKTARDTMVYDLVPTEDGNYSYEEASSDIRDKRQVDEAFFYLKDLFSMKDSLGNDFIIDDLTADQAIAKLLAGEKVEVKYQGYGHGTTEKPVGTIILELRQEGQIKNLNKHGASPEGDAVEKYVLSAEYKPTESTLGSWYWYTGSFGTKDRGKEAEDKTKTNTHIINVIKRILTIQKVNSEGKPITDADAGEAKFEIYQKDASGNKINSSVVTTSGLSYTWDYVVPDEDQKIPGNYWADTTTYYIKEVEAPKGYAAFDGEVTVTLDIGDTETKIQSLRTENVPYNWVQSADLKASGDAKYVLVTGDSNITAAVKNDKSVDITVIKTDTENVEIAGAKFTLTKASELVKDIKVIKKGGDWSNEDDRISAENGVFEIPKGGVTILGLGAGDYTLTETEPPAGYIKTLQPITFTAGRDGTVTYTNKKKNKEPDVKPGNDNTQYTVQNEPGAALPNTGGPGTRIFTILGSILVMFAGVLLVRRRRLV